MSSKTFIDLGVPAEIAAVLSAQGIDTPFPIQVDSLPDTLAGRDVLVEVKLGPAKPWLLVSRWWPGLLFLQTTTMECASQEA